MSINNDKESEPPTESEFNKLNNISDNKLQPSILSILPTTKIVFIAINHLLKNLQDNGRMDKWKSGF